MKSYLGFNELEATGVTKRFEVINKEGKNRIAIIKWIAGWRRYGFFPITDTYYDASCLLEITKFINKLMEERKGKSE